MGLAAASALALTLEGMANDSCSTTIFGPERGYSDLSTADLLVAVAAIRSVPPEDGAFVLGQVVNFLASHQQCVPQGWNPPQDAISEWSTECFLDNGWPKQVDAARSTLAGWMDGAGNQELTSLLAPLAAAGCGADNPMRCIGPTGTFPPRLGVPDASGSHDFCPDGSVGVGVAVPAARSKAGRFWQVRSDVVTVHLPPSISGVGGRLVVGGRASSVQPAIGGRLRRLARRHRKEILACMADPSRGTDGNAELIRGYSMFMLHDSRFAPGACLLRLATSIDLVWLEASVQPGRR